MLAISVRVSPWSARDVRSSSGRLTSSVPSSCATSMGAATEWVSWPLGPLTVTCRPSIATSTPLGTAMGSLPMRDMLLLLSLRLFDLSGHQTKARTSPPTPFLLACRSVSRPEDVERIATPSPPRTRGRLVDLAYTRRPGLLIRRMPAIERSRFGPNLRFTVRVLPTSASATAHDAMYPSCWRISAMCALSLLYGMDTVSWYAELAFRSRVSMSAIGSVMVIGLLRPSSPWFRAQPPQGPPRPAA